MATKYEKEVMICETGEVETDAAKTYELLRKEINALNTVPGNKGIGVLLGTRSKFTVFTRMVTH